MICRVDIVDTNAREVRDLEALGLINIHGAHLPDCLVIHPQLNGGALESGSH